MCLIVSAIRREELPLLVILLFVRRIIRHMKLRIGICDDEKYMTDMISKELFSYFENKGIDVNIDEYNSGIDLLKSTVLYDIIFLDIEMPEINGMQVAKRLRDMGNNDTSIVFLTSHVEDARKAYQVKAFRFLVKDNYENELIECIDSYIAEKLEGVRHKVAYQGSNIDVDEKSILFITSAHNGSEIWLENSVCSSEKSLNEWEKLLNSDLFIRVHKNSIINISRVDYISDVIVLLSGEHIAYSRRRKNDILKKYNEYLCGSIF